MYFERGSWKGNSMNSQKVILTLVILASLLLPTSLFTQDTQFGKNKVQYKNFEWYFIQTTHFDIYFDKGSEEIALFTADAAESAYTAISLSFRYQIAKRVSIVAYNSHNTFQQTNVISEYLEEGIGGVTEMFKNRVVLPFEGDYKKFRHVIHHELVHAVINDMFYGGTIQSIITNNITLELPLWFNEGLAEYEALKWDTDSDMFLRDATVHEYLPKINQLYGYFAYRCGQSVWNYIATKYGDQKIAEILSRIRGRRSVDQGFRSAIGLSIDELSDRWQKEQKVLYWPDVAKRKEPSDYARRLTNHTKEGNFYNTSPALSPQGDKIAFISDRDDYFDVFILNAIDGSIQEKIISGQRTPNFEELHLLTPGITWSPDGKQLALAAKSGSEDAIILVDVKSGHQEKLEFGLDGIFSVHWSPAKNDSLHHLGRLAFVGIKNNQSDVFMYDLDTKGLTNLTDDVFTDADPSWSADGTSIYFSSDRRDHLTPSSIPPDFKIQRYDYHQSDLYNIAVTSRVITRITDLPNSDETCPVAAPDGKHLFFISDMNGINNIYIKDIDRDTIYPRTNSLSAVYQLSLARDGGKLAFSSLSNAGFDLFLMRNPLQRENAERPPELTEFVKHTMYNDITSDTSGGAQSQVPIDSTIVVNLEKEDSTAIAPDNDRVNLRNYVFNDDFRTHAEGKPDSVGPPPVLNNLDEKGNFKINKYKLNFSPDIIYGNAGYNTLYGVQGSTIMAFSDMLGDHQIFLLLDLILDLKNSDYAIAYLYLPKRIDYGVQAFHSVRFLSLYDVNDQDSVDFRFRNYGLSLMAQYPVNRFDRIEFNLGLMAITRDNLYHENLNGATLPTQQRTVVTPSLSYVHDNSLWGLIAPANGERYNLSVIASPKFKSEQSLGFVTLMGDYRHYYKLWRNYTLALRLAGGSSFGADRQRFVIGGVANWINRKFENNRIPIERAEDFVFLTSAIPLRGYNFGRQLGTKYALMNTEFRFPFFGYVAAGPLPMFLQSFGGVWFIDMGSAWMYDKQFQAFAKDENGTTYMRDLLAGTGYGLRMILFGFLLKMDVAWSYDLRSFSTPKYYFSLGADL